MSSHVSTSHRTCGQTIDTLANASANVLPGGAVVVPDAYVFGSRVDLCMGVDQLEHQRRAQSGLRAITNLRALDVLAALPFGEEVPWSTLTVRERLSLDLVPSAAARCQATGVTRTAAVPATVYLVLVRRTGWRRGLESATRFAPFAPRVLVLRQYPKDRDAVRAEAAYWGVGVTVEDTQGNAELLALPDLQRTGRFSSVHWQFLEQAYQGFLRNLGRPAPR